MSGDIIGKEYLTYCSKTGMSVGRTASDYLVSIRRLDDVVLPTDLSDYKAQHGKNITDKQRKGLLKFFNFLETKKMQSNYNGYPLVVWRANLRIAEYGDERKEGRIKDLTSKEINNARDRISNDAVKDYFTLLSYSGARHSHLFEALKDKRREILHPAPGVICIDVKDLSAGTKNESRFYFPEEMEPVIKAYEHPYSADKIQKVIGASGTEDRPVNVASLRKWNYNMMLTGSKRIEETAADHIQGRSPKTVGARHYADLDKIAAEGYASLVDKFIAALVPTEVTLKTKARTGGRFTGANKTPPERRQQIIEMYKSGKSITAITKELKAGKQSVINILKEEGLKP